MAAYNGKFVKVGENLAIIDDREYRVAFDRAKAQLLTAQIEFKALSSSPIHAPTDSLETRRQIESELKSLDSLQIAHTAGRLDDAAFERLLREREASIAYLTAQRGDVIAGRSGLAQAMESIETAKLNLGWTSIQAPFAGFVADCDLVAGMRVQPGTVLMKLLDLSSLLVDVDILESEVSHIAVGQQAAASVVAIPDKEFTGTIVRLNPLVDAKTRALKATIELALPDQIVSSLRITLLPGMYVTVSIATEILSDRLLVPRATLLVRDQRQLVFILKGSFAKWHYVRIGEGNADFWEIRDGVSVGDTVIVDGHYTLAHDARVSITGVIR